LLQHCWQVVGPHGGAAWSLSTEASVGATMPASGVIVLVSSPEAGAGHPSSAGERAPPAAQPIDALASIVCGVQLTSLL
jgi:hypothetical protein